MMLSGGQAARAEQIERLTGKKEDMILCGAGPTYFKFDETGEYETIVSTTHRLNL